MLPISTSSSNLDSLKGLLLKTKDIKGKVNLMNKIAFEYHSLDPSKNKDSIEFYTKNTLILSQSNNYIKGEADALYNLGKFQLTQNITDKAMLYFIRSLVLFQKIKDEEGIAMCNLQLGVISYLTQNYIDAINYFNSSADNNNVKRSSFALKNYLCAISYAEIDSSRKAHQLFNLAIDVYKSLKDSNGISQCKTFVGKLYTNEGRYDDAIEILDENLKETISKNDNIAQYPIKSFLATAYFYKGNYESAIKYGLEAYKESINASPIYHKEATMALYKSYEKTGDHNLAYYFLKRLNNINDSINNTSIMQKIGEIKTQYIFEQEMRIQKTELDKKEALSNAEKSRIKAIVLGVSIALIIASILLFVLYKNGKEKQRINQIVVHQKFLVEKKNKEITDSIEYALRIQNAILPPTKLVKQYLNQSFIIYLPKDIVAGDFYWVEILNNQNILIAACDCTGHGVPGALVSVVCHNALNRAVREFKDYQPASILDKTAELVIENFSQSEEDIKDGMDISLALYNPETLELQWAGANNPLWVFRNEEIIEIKADKQPIGKTDNVKPFTNNIFDLQKQDTVYLITDGYADQFGGKTGEKKLTKKKFKELLLSIQHLDMEEQRLHLIASQKSWRGKNDQIDDICIIGFRV